jgi:hypothetical protein
MYYFIFSKNLDGVDGTLYKIAENEYDLNNLNINTSDYKIIEDSKENFDAVKFNTKYLSKYNGNVVTFTTYNNFFNKEDLQSYINNYKIKIKQFTDNNPNSPLLSRWSNYYNQLNNLNLDSITYPLEKSLEQYFNDLEQPSYNVLQLP